MRPLPPSSPIEPSPYSYLIPLPVSTSSASHTPLPSSDFDIVVDSSLPTSLLLPSSGEEISLLDPSPFAPHHGRYTPAHLEILRAVVASSEEQGPVPRAHLRLVSSYLNVSFGGVTKWFNRIRKKQISAIIGPPSDQGGGREDKSTVEAGETTTTVKKKRTRKLKDRPDEYQGWALEQKLKEDLDAMEKRVRAQEDQDELARMEKDVELKAAKRRAFERVGKGWEIPQLEIEFPEEWIYPVGVFLGGDVRALTPLTVGESACEGRLELASSDVVRELQQISDLNFNLDDVFSNLDDPSFSALGSDEDRHGACIEPFPRHFDVSLAVEDPGSLAFSFSQLPDPYTHLEASHQFLDQLLQQQPESNSSCLFSPTLSTSLSLSLQPAAYDFPQSEPFLNLQQQLSTDQSNELDFLTPFASELAFDASDVPSTSHLDLLSMDNEAPFELAQGSLDPLSMIYDPSHSYLPAPSQPALTPDESTHVFLAKLQDLLTPQTQPFVLHQQERVAFHPPTLLSAAFDSSPSTTVWTKPTSDLRTPVCKRAREMEDAGSVAQMMKSEEGRGVSGGSSSAARQARLEDMDAMNLLR